MIHACQPADGRLGVAPRVLGVVSFCTGVKDDGLIDCFWLSSLELGDLAPVTLLEILPSKGDVTLLFPLSCLLTCFLVSLTSSNTFN